MIYFGGEKFISVWSSVLLGHVNKVATFGRYCVTPEKSKISDFVLRVMKDTLSEWCVFRA